MNKLYILRNTINNKRNNFLDTKTDTLIKFFVKKTNYSNYIYIFAAPSNVSLRENTINTNCD